MLADLHESARESKKTPGDGDAPAAARRLQVHKTDALTQCTIECVAPSWPLRHAAN